MTTTSSRTGLAPNVTVALLNELKSRIDVPADRPQLAVHAPFTGTQFAAVPIAEEGDVRAAVERARTAQRSWAATSMDERLAVFSRFHDILIDRADTAMDLIQLEGGKARIPAFEEVFDTVATTRYYMKTGPGLMKRRRRSVSIPGMTTAYQYRHPIGVIGSITPWNFPFNLSIADIIPALIAGNAVVGKPDEKTPFSMLYGASLLAEAGLPEGLLQVVTGPGEDLGSPLIDSVDFVSFTGSTAVGRLIAEQAGRRLIASSMELGGKNAAIVLADADLDRAVPGLSRAVFANGGQVCIAMERIYVADEILDEFTERFVRHTLSLEMSSAFDYSSATSSMISEEHLDRVHAHVDDAVSLGATLLAGGRTRPDIGPLFYEPTLLTDVDETMDLCRTETFGPVASIYGFGQVDEAIALANDSDFGLNYSVWTGNRRNGVDIATQLHAGTVGVNDGFHAAWSTYDAPMGGYKSSGLGRRHGSIGLTKFTESQTVAIQNFGEAFAPPAGMTYDDLQSLIGPVLKLARRLPFYK